MEEKRNFDLLTLGQVLLRLSPPNNDRLVRGDTFVKQVGGAELNVAVGVALLGLRTGVISKLPSHDMGSFMKGKIRSYGVSDDFFMLVFIIMRMALIRENRRLFMIVPTVLSIL